MTRLDAVRGKLQGCIDGLAANRGSLLYVANSFGEPDLSDAARELGVITAREEKIADAIRESIAQLSLVDPS